MHQRSRAFQRVVWLFDGSFDQHSCLNTPDSMHHIGVNALGCIRQGGVFKISCLCGVKPDGREVRKDLAREPDSFLEEF